MRRQFGGNLRASSCGKVAKQLDCKLVPASVCCAAREAFQTVAPPEPLQGCCACVHGGRGDRSVEAHGMGQATGNHKGL